MIYTIMLGKTLNVPLAENLNNAGSIETKYVVFICGIVLFILGAIIMTVRKSKRQKKGLMDEDYSYKPSEQDITFEKIQMFHDILGVDVSFDIVFNNHFADSGLKENPETQVPIYYEKMIRNEIQHTLPNDHLTNGASNPLNRRIPVDIFDVPLPDTTADITTKLINREEAVVKYIFIHMGITGDFIDEVLPVNRRYFRTVSNYLDQFPFDYVNRKPLDM